MKEEKILNNIGLVYNAIQKMNFQQRNDDEEWDEIYIAGVIGLIKAIDNYKKCDTKESTYYYKCIANEIKHIYTLRTAQKRNKKTYSLDNFISITDIFFVETIPAGINIEEDYIKKEEINEMLSKLENYKNKKHRDIVKEIFGIGCDKKMLKDIAKKYNISTQAIHEIKVKVLKNLKKELEQYNNI